MKTALVLILSILSLWLLSCEAGKLPAVGKDDEIVVFADDTTWNALEPTLRSVFEDTLYTPQPEQWFELHRNPFDLYSAFESQKNRIIIGALDGDGPVSRFLVNALDSTVRREVVEGREFVINRYDGNAKGQIQMFLVAPTLNDLETSMNDRAADLLYFFQRMSLRRELSAIEAESRYHKKDIERDLMRRYQWSMTIQHDYWVATDTSEARFFWVRRANPADLERWIFVSWWDDANPAVMTDAWVMAARDSITARYYRTLQDDEYVEIAPYYLQFQTIEFLGRYAIEMRGCWRFSDHSGGGPFVTYAFYDEPSRRIYLIDGSVFAPRVTKRSLIVQVDGLLHTFRTAQDLSKEAREDIFGEK